MVLYTGIGTVCLPLIISTLLVREIGAVTWAFLAPVFSLVFAYVSGAMSLGPFGWGGVSLIVMSLLFQANAGRPQEKPMTSVEASGPGLVPGSSAQ